jgi:hypothetical protein
MNQKQLVNKLYTGLLTNLLDDLADSSKCGPGLYQVVRGVIQDNRDLLDSIPTEDATSLETKFASSVPFKFGSSVTNQKSVSL